MIEGVSSASINALIVITSLRPHEMGLSDRLFEDVETGIPDGLHYQRLEPDSAEGLFDCLDEIRVSCVKGLKPIIHFDMHGDEANGLVVAATGEIVSWVVVSEKLREINRATSNNLCIVSLACFGFHLIQDLDIQDLTPFYLLIGPEKEVRAGDLEEAIRPFYRDLFTEWNFVDAFEKHLSLLARMYHCEKFFLIVLGRYVLAHCTGEGLRQRVERLVTHHVQSGNRSISIRNFRRKAKRQLRPDASLMEKFRPVFLAGKEPAFTFDEMMRVVEDAKCERGRTSNRAARGQ